jgi:hypothetical protein
MNKKTDVDDSSMSPASRRLRLARVDHEGGEAGGLCPLNPRDDAAPEPLADSQEPWPDWLEEGPREGIAGTIVPIDTPPPSRPHRPKGA